MINIILIVILIIIFNRLLYVIIIFLYLRLLSLKLYKLGVVSKKSCLPNKFSEFQITSVPFGFHKDFAPKNKLEIKYFIN